MHSLSKRFLDLSLAIPNLVGVLVAFVVLGYLMMHAIKKFRTIKLEREDDKLIQRYFQNEIKNNNI